MEKVLQMRDFFLFFSLKMVRFFNGRIAQLVRALHSHCKGLWFESTCAHMKIIKPVFRKLHWTEHVKVKMRQYGLSKQKIFSILRKPERCEVGIAPGTNAVMRTNKIFFNSKQVSLKDAFKPKKAPGEIWIMYRDTPEYRKIISAWRFPGVSKPGEEIPIPKDILSELKISHEV